MSEMVERLAKAMLASVAHDDGPWDHMADNWREHYRCLARTAIEAMREPTKDMLDAAGTDWFRLELAWQIMIDTALK